MAWIPMVDEPDAEGTLAELYVSARARFGFVPDAVRIFSIRPDVAVVQDALRQAVLGEASTLGARRADLIGAAVSGMNHCEYCGTAHTGLLARRGDLDGDEAVQVYKDWRRVDLAPDEQKMLEFAEKLTFTPAMVTEADVQELRDHGFSDVNVFDIVLLTAYRNFMNRVNDGLGVATDRLRGRFGPEHVEAIANT
ncbi:MAG: peroxidase-related enzyme [Actinomycetota bacterium]